MNRKEELWNTFKNSGKVEDYLAYKNEDNEEEEQIINLFLKQRVTFLVILFYLHFYNWEI